MTNTKARSAFLATVARRIAEAHPEHITQGGRLLPLAKKMMTETGCGVDAAKRHVAKQLRLIRGEIVADNWGGQRAGSGFPAGTKRESRRGKAIERKEQNMSREFEMQELLGCETTQDIVKWFGNLTESQIAAELNRCWPHESGNEAFAEEIFEFVAAHNPTT